jgi:hypothetical protein
MLLVSLNFGTTNKIKYEDTDDNGCGPGRRPADDDRLLLNLQNRFMHQDGLGVQRSLLQGSGDVREMLHGRRRLRQVLPQVVSAD